MKILWHVDPLLGNDRETTRQRSVNSNRGTVFSVRSVPRYNKHSSVDEKSRRLMWDGRPPAWERVVGQSLAGKNVSTEAEDTAEISHQQMTGEDTAEWEDLVCAVVNCRNVRISDSAIVTCSYDLWVFNKSNYQSKTRLQSLHNNVTTHEYLCVSAVTLTCRVVSFVWIGINPYSWRRRISISLWALWVFIIPHLFIIFEKYYLVGNNAM
jgi:hypothetical protein